MQFDDNDTTRFEERDSSPAIAPPPGETVAVSPGDGARSALYVAQQASLAEYTPGLNPLVNCAAHLVLEMVRLRTPAAETPETPNSPTEARREDGQELENLRRRLEAEIKGFESRALGSEIDNAQVLAAKYVLCTALDESVSTSPLGAGGDWSPKALLSTFHNETWGGEKFFQITDRCMQQPARNLYLLELIYLLLSLGFEGRYKLQSRGPIELELLRELIYRQVRMLRGEPPLDLCKKLPEGRYRNRIYAYVPASLLIMFVVFCLAVSYMGFAHILDNRAEPILKQFAAPGEAVAGGIR